MERVWWRDGVLSQVYPRSYADSNADGQGDLGGLIEKLPYLAWLGVEGVWLDPISASANVDWGYDVTDYTAVQPDFGTLEDAERLFTVAGKLNLKVILDIVPNHTSDQHPWFLNARSAPDARYRDFYVWADPKPDGSAPNNWVSMFGGSAWKWHASSGQYYLHNFTAQQPDLNWWNPEVRAEFERILRFWLDKGAAGYRIDVCQAIIKDKLLRDNPPSTPDDRRNVRLRGQKPYYCMNRPEVHEVLRSWRELADSYPQQPILLGETNMHDLDVLARYYGQAPGDELHMAFNFPFMGQPYEATALASIIERTEASLPAHAHPVWTISNHDAPRYVTRWCGNDQSKVRGALLLLLALRGTPMIYYGDELGLPDAPPIPVEQSRDPLALGTLPGKDSRDPCRAPMPWSAAPGAGFCPDEVVPWLPCAHQGEFNVAAQCADPDSTLHFTRRLIAFRREHPDLYRAPMRLLEAPPGVLGLARGGLALYLNLSEAPQIINDDGAVLLATDRAATPTDTHPGPLAPWQGVIITRVPTA